jgi:hypothetical protein
LFQFATISGDLPSECLLSAFSISAVPCGYVKERPMALAIDATLPPFRSLSRYRVTKSAFFSENRQISALCFPISAFPRHPSNENAIFIRKLADFSRISLFGHIFLRPLQELNRDRGLQ